MERKGQGKGIPTHGKFSGTLPPHEASPLDRASVTGLAYQRGRPHRCGYCGTGFAWVLVGSAYPLRFTGGGGTRLGASRVGLSTAVHWGGRDSLRCQQSRPIRCGTNEVGI
ncbi:hypothetical protein Acsp05_32560 [Actinokineospora sp. NBRC 105648]|nr:hypothetical protein Acsp05_32560 [Actinokineospora sp. NBRC 105648]